MSQVKKEKEKKKKGSRLEEKLNCVFGGNPITYIENPTESTKKLLAPVTESGQVSRREGKTSKSTVFLHPADKQLEAAI